ncbi:O-antigen translocase [Pseudomonas veronii]|jgi:O-antigen/teichoic acid export membrane protein|uniref:O-antigen translocase n=1 Tax=Pseudomonas veronii TaxID=76761 RepID=UPI001474D4BD|nr:O-antigen translocase [Pseudomonas veronii]MCT8963102.1 O-antigen translocase [Pseudomonas veronii]NMX49502.1 O-antigen translocase [Pseudomonas veronii]
MSMVSSLALTSLAHAAKILAGFALLKIMAVYLGPDGIGQLGHMMSVVSILTVLSGGGVINGVVKYTSEYRSRPVVLFRFVSASASYAVCFALALMVLGIIFSGPIARLVFNDGDMYPVICILAVMQLFFAFANIVFGVSNGLMDTKVFAFSQLFGSLLSIPLFWAVIYYFAVPGAALSMVFASSLCAIPAFFYFRKSKFWNRINLSLSLNSSFSKLFSYTVMLLFSTVCFPIVEIFVRQMLITQVGFHDAGIWQASIRLSAAYLGFFTVFLSFYFMPKASLLNENSKLSSLVFKCLLFVQAAFFLGALVLYLGRGFFITLLFSLEFSGLKDLIAYQLIGDFFKISSYVFGFIAVAKAATKLYIAAEIIQGGVFFGIATFLSSRVQGVESVMQAYMLTYIVYFVVSAVSTIVYLRRRGNKERAAVGKTLMEKT